MATLSRQTTWASLQTLTASNLNNEFNNIINGWNNHDAGTSVWTVVNSASYKRSGTAFPIIYQVVSATSTTSFSTSSSTFQTTNLAGTITPSSTSNKILILATGSIVNGNLNATDACASLFRGATNLGGSNGLVLIDSAITGTPTLTVPCTMSLYDSPATTSATTYSVKIRSSDNATTCKFGFSANDTQSIILVEIGL